MTFALGDLLVRAARSGRRVKKPFPMVGAPAHGEVFGWARTR